MLVSRVEEILVRWHIVPNEIVSLPSSKQREPGSEVELNGVIHDLHVAGGNVADVVPVVDILAGGGQQGLKVLHTGNSRALSLILVSDEM